MGHLQAWWVSTTFRRMPIRYSDGESTERRIAEVLESAAALRADTSIGYEHYGKWPFRYHLSPIRANLFRPFQLSGLDILEIGAGMGALSRYLAEKCHHLHVIEGTQERYRAIRARLRDINNWTGEVAEFSKVMPAANFDVVSIVGVLEYAEKFLKGEGSLSAHAVFLQHAKRFMKPGGVVALAIENALGLKYWSGAAEDHTGRLFDGILGYGDKPGPKTFSKRELIDLLEQSGFSNIRFFYPFPDYKMPSCLLTDEMIRLAPECAADLASFHKFENYCTERVRYFPDALVTLSASRGGLLADMANSFLVLASVDAASPVLEAMVGSQSLAWHFSRSKVTRFVQGVNQIEVVKDTGQTPLIAGLPMRFSLARSAYFGDWDHFLEKFRHFLKWSFGHHALEMEPTHLAPRSVDAVFLNAIDRGDCYAIFDHEWEHDKTVLKHWFIFRNVFALIRDLDVLNSSAPFRNLHELYQTLCTAMAVQSEFSKAVELETRFQYRASPERSVEIHRQELMKLFFADFPPNPFPRDPNTEFCLRSRIQHLEAENQSMKAFMNRREIKVARKTARFLKRMISPESLPHG